MANALESASLVMIPSGYEDGTLGSLKPTDGTGDFTFSRGSNTSATRVNADGYIEKGYENTIIGSNDFARDDSSYLITNGEAGYDGTNDAWLVNKLATGNAYFGKNSLVYTGVVTISFYAKAGTLDRIFLFTAGDAARFDLENVTATRAGGTPIAQTIELVSGTTDWYRCSITINKNETNNLLLKPQNASNQDAAGTIYIQDAMLNQGLVAYPYKETTTAPVAGGILEDMPRLDYSNGSCPALLLEPSRTNVLEHSEYISSATFSFSNISFDYNSASSPEGKTNATKLIVTSGGGNTRLFKQTSGSGSQVVSVFAKAGEKNAISVSSYTGTGYLYAMYNLTNGTLINSIADDTGIEDMGNGWYRVWVYVANSTNRYAHLSIGDSTDSPAYTLSATGNGSDGLYIYGFQAEQDATYPTSYIPTYGVSQTRLGDTLANLLDISSFTSAYNTLFFDWGDMEGKSTFNRDIVRGYVNDNFLQSFRIVSLTDGRLRYQVYSNTSTTSVDYTCTTRDKVAFVLNGLNSKLFVNGSLVHTYITEVPEGLEMLNYNGLSRNVTNQFTIFPTALTDSECIELTTI
jgi:hypothetical protein